ncbi:MAG: hypothetical protein K2M97_07830 [Muribaculaceae bacterium]|nr:hypothetical protein [Muribaculaceae bacterium]
MKSKRDLKKQIKYICGDLVGECMILGEIVPEEKQNEVGQLIIDIAVLQESTLDKVNFSFDKTERDFPTRHDYLKARSRYFNAAYTKLHDEFNAGLSAAVHRMNELAGLAKK